MFKTSDGLLGQCVSSESPSSQAEVLVNEIGSVLSNMENRLAPVLMPEASVHVKESADNMKSTTVLSPLLTQLEDLLRYANNIRDRIAV